MRRRSLTPDRRDSHHTEWPREAAELTVARRPRGESVAEEGRRNLMKIESGDERLRQSASRRPARAKGRPCRVDLSCPDFQSDATLDVLSIPDGTSDGSCSSWRWPRLPLLH